MRIASKQMAIKHFFFVIVISAYYCYYYFVKCNPQVHKICIYGCIHRKVTQPKVKYLYIHLNIVINISQKYKNKAYILCLITTHG